MKAALQRETPRLLRAAAGLACATLAACSMGGSGVAPSSSNVEVTPRPPAGVEAYLRSTASAVTGKVRVIDRADGATVLLSMINLPPGQYRFAFHAVPNCSSPNGFSAGPLWAPSGASDPRNIAPTLFTNQDGTAEASLFVRGVHTTGADGVSGRSVVIYAGNAVTDAQPDVRNNRVACGIFEPSTPFAF